MSERTAYACDGPGCDVIWPARETGMGTGLVPKGWLEIWRGAERWHFHTWECLSRFAEEQRSVRVIEGERDSE